jgi:hypothetical protein
MWQEKPTDLPSFNLMREETIGGQPGGSEFEEVAA